MKSKLYKAAVLLLLAALVGSVFVFGWSHYVEYSSRQALHLVSQHAHDITAVEVLSITGASESGAAGSYRLPYDHARYGVTARHTLTGEQAAELVRTWSRVRFIEGILAGCHSPGFVLRFLAGHRTVFEVAVCFDCENVSYSPAPFESALIQMSTPKFDPKSGTEELKTFLTQLQ